MTRTATAPVKIRPATGPFVEACAQYGSPGIGPLACDAVVQIRTVAARAAAIASVTTLNRLMAR